MKRIILFFILIFSVGENVFAQSKPIETFRNFWNTALSNDYEGAQKFVGKISKAQVIEEEKYNENFQIIYRNKLQFPELKSFRDSADSAYFNFQIETKEEKKFRGQALLLKRDGEWKIVLFDLKSVGEIKPLPILGNLYSSR